MNGDQTRMANAAGNPNKLKMERRKDRRRRRLQHLNKLNYLIVVFSFCWLAAARIDGFAYPPTFIGSSAVQPSRRGFAHSVSSRETLLLKAAFGTQSTPNALADEELPPPPPPQQQEQQQHKIPRKNSSYIRFASPLLEFGYPPAVEEFQQGKTSAKPLLLYIPGFDGTYLSAFFQYPELHSVFEVRCLVSTMQDRSTFDDLKESILMFLQQETQQQQQGKQAKQQLDVSQSKDAMIAPSQKDVGESSYFSPASLFSSILRQINIVNPQPPSQSTSSTQTRDASSATTGRPVYIAGESFGGIMACEVALALLLQDDATKDGDKTPAINFQGLVLINAATCYDRSQLAAQGPAIAKLPSLLYFFGILKLLPMFLDDISLPQFLAIIQGKALPSLIDNPIREAYMGRLAFSLPLLLKFMPQETFQWRLGQWLSVGCQRMQSNNHELEQQLTQRARSQGLRTLIIAGEKDLTLPSIAEAERLAQLLPNSHVHVVPNVGHANTCGTCLDLAAEMRNWFPALRQQEQLPIMDAPKSFNGQTQVSNKSSGTESNQGPTENSTSNNNVVTSLGRTSMKKVAAEGKGFYFGMEPRYDGKRIGLSPLLYWSKEYFRKLDGFSPH